MEHEDKVVFLPFPNTKVYQKKFYTLYFNKNFILVNPKSIYFNLVSDIIRSTKNKLFSGGYKFYSLVILNDELCYINYGTVINNIIEQWKDKVLDDTNPATLYIVKINKYGFPDFSKSHIIDKTICIQEYLNEYNVHSHMNNVVDELNSLININIIDNTFENFYNCLLNLNDGDINRVINSLNYVSLIRRYKLNKLGFND